MTKRLVIAATIALAAIFLAAGIQRALLAPPSERSSKPAAPTPRPGAAQALTRPAPTANVTELVGQLEVRNSDGAWTPLKLGDRIQERDVLRTGDDSKGTIDLGDRVTLSIAGNTTFEIDKVSAVLSRVILDDGRIASRVQQDPNYKFRVEVRGTDASAETSGAEFSVMKRGDSPVSVAAERGEVVVQAQGGSLTLAAGQQSTIEPGEQPSPATAIPPSLFVKLGRPPPARQRTKTVSIEGITSPGALVDVGGHRTHADASGRFVQEVAMKEGPNDIVIRVEDTLGRQERTSVPRIIVDSQPPGVKGEVTW